jgi:hypothetical protein
MINIVSINSEEVLDTGSTKILYNTAKGNVFAEQLAQQFYSEQGYDSKWSENNFWWTIMALLFWDIIFAKVEGAVCCKINGEEHYLRPDDASFDKLYNSFIPLNGMPSDLFSIEFYQRRRSIIENKFKELKNSDLIEKLKVSYNSHKGQNCRLIEKWDRFSLDEMINIMQFIPKEVLLGIFKRMIQDFRSLRSGLPDLIVYKQGEFFFSEVKSKKDKLSKNQEEWNDYLSSDLNQRVDIVYINHSEHDIEKLKKRDALKESKEIRISFGQSSSKKREEAIEFIKKQSDFSCSGEGKDAIYSATFNTKDLESLFKVLDLTSGWKSKHIEIDGVEVESTVLRNALYCYEEKVSKHVSDLWCTKIETWEGVKKTKYGCRRIYLNQTNENRWDNFGYVDTDKGEWVFDKNKLLLEIGEQIGILQYCPVFNPEKVRKVIDKLPDRVNPINNIDWGFIGTDNTNWIYHEGKWLNSIWGEKEFPGFIMMTGIINLNKNELDQIINKSKKDINTVSTLSSKTQQKKTGCFIATAVFDSYESIEVKQLRILRDKYLLKSFFGRLTVSTYYRIGPTLAIIIGKSNLIKYFIKKCLKIIIQKISE